MAGWFLNVRWLHSWKNIYNISKHIIPWPQHILHWVRYFRNRDFSSGLWRNCQQLLWFLNPLNPNFFGGRGVQKHTLTHQFKVSQVCIISPFHGTTNRTGFITKSFLSSFGLWTLESSDNMHHCSLSLSFYHGKCSHSHKNSVKVKLSN